MVSEIVVLERDRKIIREIDRWRVCQGRHIKELAEFSGQRACDRRLRKLMQAGYVSREKILYGVAGIYRVTNKGAKLEGLGKTRNKIRIEQIRHDIAVLDTAIYFNKNHGLAYKNIRTELELHRLDGFGIRKHRPDFIFKKEDKTTCVEIELALKSKNRFETIISDNFMKYDKQIWVVPDFECKIAKTLQNSKVKYTNIEILTISEIQGTKENNENEQLFTSPMESGQIDLDI
ncbi:MAG: hypothetical protein FWC78_04990 [Defluviitaleaceae bacterium]|nr:hypothetical protein [Defluviitaleaceae bacterium]